MKRVIIAGNVTNEAQVFLVSHNTQLEQYLSLSLITLPEDAVIEKQDQPGRYLVAFWTPTEELEPDALLVDVALNVYETKIILHKDHWEEKTNS